MKVAALDLGSNTFICLIAEVQQNQISQVYFDQVEMVRLGENVSKTKEFSAAALQRAEKALDLFASKIKEHNCERILAMATSAARDVKNAEQLFEICRTRNIPVEIISGPLEAELTFQGAMSGIKQAAKIRRLVVDIGGGSTEFILGSGNIVEGAQSLNLGCVRLKEKNLDQQQARLHVREQLAQLKLNTQNIEQLLAVAGTPTELARLQTGGAFDPVKIEGLFISLKVLDEWVDRLYSLTPGQITETYQVNPGRADVLGVGALILSESLRYFSKDGFFSSIRGVRHGVALEIERRISA
jgi:exopolyphosphatase / guanosine-5'-triphosphate,3'-diphosphate pyrophosphatase